MAVGRQRMVVFDCANAARLAMFWHELTGATVNARGDDWWSLHAPDGGIRLGFQQVPEDKLMKNRVHLDLDVDALEDAVAAAEAIGARRVGEPIREEGDEVFQVMLDPEGNEFCLLEGYR